MDEVICTVDKCSKRAKGNLSYLNSLSKRIMNVPYCLHHLLTGRKIFTQWKYKEIGITMFNEDKK